LDNALTTLTRFKIDYFPVLPSRTKPSSFQFHPNKPVRIVISTC
jgi:hypothetical protein